MSTLTVKPLFYIIALIVLSDWDRQILGTCLERIKSLDFFLLLLLE